MPNFFIELKNKHKTKMKEYRNHRVFKNLQKYAILYGRLSNAVFRFLTPGIKGIGNIDTYTFLSMQGTLESINLILLEGKINDSYALLRKYHDSLMINIYTNLYLIDNYSESKFVIEQIDNWYKGLDTLPEYRIMSQYIRKSNKLLNLNELLYKDSKYKKIRDRCNTHVHYNTHFTMLLNNKQLSTNRIKYLDTFCEDLNDLLILHLAYLFILSDHYMMSSDYTDSLDIGIIPDEDSQYEVANFIRDIVDNLILESRKDIFEEIKKSSSMNL